MTATLNVTEVLSEALPYLTKTARRYAEMANMDAEDLTQDASIAVIEGCRIYDDSLGVSAAKWGYYVGNRQMMDTLRHEVGRRGTRPRRDSINGMSHSLEATESFDLNEMLSELSADAQEAIMAVIEPPPEVVIRCLSVREDVYARTDTLRAAVREYLSDLGWGASRIAEVWSEIGEALLEG